jgi:2-oxoglutarate dehydrogenase E2 component (dihydrolipoamide succinyltransferase)
MTIQITVPTLGESVTEATVARWLKAVGDAVTVDEPLVELETDKVNVEVNAPASGTLSDIAAPEGSEIAVGGVLGSIAEGEAAATPQPPKPEAQAEAKPEPKPEPKAAAPKPEAKPEPKPEPAAPRPDAAAALSPAVRRLVEEHGLDPARITGTGRDGRLTKGDVLAAIDSGSAKAAPAPTPAPTPTPAEKPREAPAREIGPREERVKMSRLRRMVAERLKDAQNTAAMLTTFNEIDMTAATQLRNRYREAFEKKHGVRLGFMALFVKACVTALKEFPSVNAEIDGADVIFKNHYDIAIAVASPQGLVVPVVRDCDALTVPEIEAAIADLGRRARDGKLAIEDLQGGTFTITNGGVFGSLMSTPILNPPQSGILGMHKVMQRPMVMDDGAIQARPMMYVALTYDHRIIDGREAVSFLVRVKECVEDPQRILLGA